jgi:hypothetical protein
LVSVTAPIASPTAAPKIEPKIRSLLSIRSIAIVPPVQNDPHFCVRYQLIRHYTCLSLFYGKNESCQYTVFNPV